MKPKDTTMLSVTRVRKGVIEVATDQLIREEPLEVRIAGDPHWVTMRTPGHDRELVLGFLLSEGIIQSANDLSLLAHCDRVEESARGNVMEVTLAPGVKPPRDAIETKRNTTITSACGVCGRQTIDDLLSRLQPLPSVQALRTPTLLQAIAHLQEQQPLYRATGGCHAASLLRYDGTHIATYEDVGRHNAVDKVLGSQLRKNALPLREHFLLVSGRSSFELVQKCVSAGISALISVSAASSLAVELAQRTNLLLIGFARDESFVVYNGKELVAVEA